MKRMLGWFAACERPASDNSEESKKRRNMAGGNVGGMRVIAQKQTRSQGAGGIDYLAGFLIDALPFPAPPPWGTTLTAFAGMGRSDEVSRGSSAGRCCKKKSRY